MLKTMTSQQAGALVRTNGYSAYPQQLNSDSTANSFNFSMRGVVSSISFG